MDNGWCFFWVLPPVLNINLAIVAFMGLSILILAKVYTTEDIREGGGDALETYIWFAILFMISSELNNLRSMKILGAQLATYVNNFHWISVYILLPVLYILIHYLFVSQTAHLLALYAVFLQVGVNAEVPVALMVFMLSFATNLFVAISPQASSSYILFMGSGFLPSKEIYKQRIVATLLNIIIFLLATPWILWATSFF